MMDARRTRGQAETLKYILKLLRELHLLTFSAQITEAGKSIQLTAEGGRVIWQIDAFSYHKERGQVNNVISDTKC